MSQGKNIIKYKFHEKWSGDSDNPLLITCLLYAQLSNEDMIYR
jgi:hypothetical protein